MKKADRILIIALMIFSALCLIPLLNGSIQPEVAVVKVQNEEVMRVDLSEDNVYTVQGTNGPITIEVKDGAIRVTQETSLHHYCSIQGFVNSSNTPIVCLPNETVITIEGKDGQEDTVVS